MPEGSAERLRTLQAQAAELAALTLAQNAEREEAALAAADAAFLSKLEAAGLPAPSDPRAARVAAEAAERETALARQAEAVAAAKRQAEREAEQTSEAEREAQQAAREALAPAEQSEPIDLGPALEGDCLWALRREVLLGIRAARGITDLDGLSAVLSEAAALEALWLEVFP